MRLQEAYQLLGLDASSSDLEIKEKYKSLAKSRHPDRNNSTKSSNQDFIRIKQAYDTIVRERLKQPSLSKQIKSNPSKSHQRMNSLDPNSPDLNRLTIGFLNWLNSLRHPIMRMSHERVLSQKSVCTHKVNPNDICLKCY